jgi:methionine sulfoxide reductase heme-binding subunit
MQDLRRNGLLILTHVAGWSPLLWLMADAMRGELTVNPIQQATIRTGKTALVFLVLTLAVTPANTLFGLRQLIPLRRWLGLYAFLYAAVHFMIFVGLDYTFDPLLLREAIFEKRFALVGFSAFVILAPLALTSTRGWMRRLGKRWKRLHRMIYLAGPLVIVHYAWSQKSDIRVPLLYGALVILLLALRIPRIRAAASRARQVPRALAGWLGSLIH